MVVYADLVFFGNLLLNAMLMLCTGRLCGMRAKFWRLLLAAGFGAVYAVFQPALFVLEHPLSKLFLFAGMLLLYAGKTSLKMYLQLGLVFLLVTAGGGGLTIALAGEQISGTQAMLLSMLVGLLGALALFLFSGQLRANLRLRAQYCEVEIETEQGKVELRAFLDTGCRLREPVSQRPVLLANRVSLQKVLPCVCDRALQGLPETGEPPGAERLYVVPYRSVGKQGVLFGFLPKQVTVKGRQIDCIVAVTENLHTGYEAIINPIAL